MSVISSGTTLTTALVQTGDTNGNLVFKTGASGTTALTLGSDQSATFAGAISLGALTTSGNLTFTGTGNRILGDFSNATLANRTMFQSSTTNAATAVLTIPNGTSTTAVFEALNSSDATNGSRLYLNANSTTAEIGAGVRGTGTFLPMTFLTGNSERLRIDTSGNVGIGTSSPTNFGSAFKMLAVQGSDYGVIQAISSSGSTTLEMMGASGIGYVGTRTNHPVAFRTNDTERMRIDSAGNLLVGTTNSSLSAGTGFKFGYSATAPYCGQVVNTASAHNTYHFYNENATNNGYRFYVKVDGGIDNYSGNNSNLSDERTKTNIELSGNYLEKICSIPVKVFNYKDEAEGEQKTLGVIAQDVETIAPEFVNNEGFGENVKGETPLKSIYTTDMMFALMKCIQEQQAIITDQASTIAAFEARLTALEGTK